MAVNEACLNNVSFKLLKTAAIHLPEEIVEALKKALAGETDSTAQAQIQTMLDNVDAAAKNQSALCQDTGIPAFFIKLGTKVQLEGDPKKAICDAVEKATEEVPLRQNCIHPLTFCNPGTNTGWGIPSIHWEIEPESDYLEITAVPKGFGGENRSAQMWVWTSENTTQATMRAVLDVVEDSLGEPCPPVIFTIGIGGSSDLSMINAKKALFRVPFNADHPDPVVADLENKILKAVNDTKVGPMGFGGNTYALAVNIEIAGSHTGIVPITVGCSCWALRYSTAKIYNNGSIEYDTHPFI